MCHNGGPIPFTLKTNFPNGFSVRLHFQVYSLSLCSLSLSLLLSLSFSHLIFLDWPRLFSLASQEGENFFPVTDSWRNQRKKIGWCSLAIQVCMSRLLLANFCVREKKEKREGNKITATLQTSFFPSREKGPDTRIFLLSLLGEEYKICAGKSPSFPRVCFRKVGHRERRNKKKALRESVGERGYCISPPFLLIAAPRETHLLCSNPCQAACCCCTDIYKRKRTDIRLSII